ncbi:uncharacterized protein BO96DRAFT_364439 [Aspergillus niger CBS 101883]|uniref:uncharacterized protein n=1 Tax=Aspergillus lacticoffeatus (strain CBS 101883) TaxID=1450533 RepID=UPI000D7F26C5|nr:uncharacterized protein BO96DRAFT_364439 [Aspergillus niger CBS 101883]PYH57693.1 hypothetical protein BO96DRAFT_364439 [Aspergillus niger CBS 101883]
MERRNRRGRENKKRKLEATHGLATMRKGKSDSHARDSADRLAARIPPSFEMQDLTGKNKWRLMPGCCFQLHVKVPCRAVIGIHGVKLTRHGDTPYNPNQKGAVKLSLQRDPEGTTVMDASRTKDEATICLPPARLTSESVDSGQGSQTCCAGLLLTRSGIRPLSEQGPSYVDAATPLSEYANGGWAIMLSREFRPSLCFSRGKWSNDPGHPRGHKPPRTVGGRELSAWVKYVRERKRDRERPRKPPPCHGGLASRWIPVSPSIVSCSCRASSFDGSLQFDFRPEISGHEALLTERVLGPERWKCTSDPAGRDGVEEKK